MKGSPRPLGGACLCGTSRLRTISVLLALALVSHADGPIRAQGTTLEQAVRYLESQHDTTTGRWSVGSASSFEDTAVAYLAIAAARSDASISAGFPDPFTDAPDFLASLSDVETRTLAVRVGVGLAAQMNIGSDLQALLLRQNTDGGWGASEGRESNVRDTVDVLHALLAQDSDVLPMQAMQDVTRFLRQAASTQQFDVPVGDGTFTTVRRSLWSDASRDSVRETVTTTARTVVALRMLSERTDGTVDVSDVLANGVRYIEHAISSDGTPPFSLPGYSFSALGNHDKSLILQAVVSIGDPAIHVGPLADVLADANQYQGFLFWTDDTSGSPVTDVMTTARVASLLTSTSPPPGVQQPDLSFVSGSLRYSYNQPSYSRAPEVAVVDVPDEMPVLGITFDVKNQGARIDQLGQVADDDAGSNANPDLYVSLHDRSAYNGLPALRQQRLLDPLSGNANSNDAEVIEAGQAIEFTAFLVGWPAAGYETLAFALDNPPREQSLYANTGFEGAVVESDELNNQLLVSPDYSRLLPYVFVNARQDIAVRPDFPVQGQSSNGVAVTAIAVCAGGPVPAGALVQAEFVLYDDSRLREQDQVGQPVMSSPQQFAEPNAGPFTFESGSIGASTLSIGTRYYCRVNTIVTLAPGTDEERMLKVRGASTYFDYQQFASLPDLVIDTNGPSFTDSLGNPLSSTPRFGDSFSVKVNVENTGSGDVVAQPFTVGLYRRDPFDLPPGVGLNAGLGPPLAEATVSNLAQGAIEPLILTPTETMPLTDSLFLWIDTPFVYNPSIGYEDVETIAGSVEELDDSNNYIPIPVIIDQQESDLVVLADSVSVAPLDLALSPTIEVSGLVANIGANLLDDMQPSSSAAIVELSVWSVPGDGDVPDPQAPPELVRTVEIPPLQLGAASVAPADFVWLPGDAGWRYLRLTISHPDETGITTNNSYTWWQMIDRTTVTVAYSADLIDILDNVTDPNDPNYIGAAFSMSDAFVAANGIEFDVNRMSDNQPLSPPPGMEFRYDCVLLDSNGEIAAIMIPRGGGAHEFKLRSDLVGTLPPAEYRVRGRLLLQDIDDGSSRVLAQDQSLKLNIGNTIRVTSVYPVMPSLPLVAGQNFDAFFAADPIRLGATSIVNSPTGAKSPLSAELLVLTPDNGYQPVLEADLPITVSLGESPSAILNSGTNSDIVATVTPTLNVPGDPPNYELPVGNYQLLFTFAQDEMFRDDNYVDGVPLGTGGGLFAKEGVESFMLTKRVYRADSDDVPATDLPPRDGQRVRIEITITKTESQ